jgi:hypothetical protein
VDKNREVVEDVMWYAVRDVGERVLAGVDTSAKELVSEVDALIGAEVSLALEEGSLVSEALSWMDEAGPRETLPLVDGLEEQLRNDIKLVDPEVVAEYRFSGLELLANALLASGAVNAFTDQSRIFVPKRMEG